MAHSYYYFAASLIHIQFGDKTPLTVDEFLVDCARLLTADDYACLAAVVSGEPCDFNNNTARAWYRFEHDLKNEFAFQRGEKKGNPAAYVRGSREINPVARDLAAQVFKTDNPLEAEKMIDTARWRFLDEMAVGQYFNFDYILIYGLKLKILERYEHIESPKGKEIFEKVKNVDDILVGLI